MEGIVRAIKSINCEILIQYVNLNGLVHHQNDVIIQTPSFKPVFPKDRHLEKCW